MKRADALGVKARRRRERARLRWEEIFGGSGKEVENESEGCAKCRRVLEMAVKRNQ